MATSSGLHIAVRVRERSPGAGAPDAADLLAGLRARPRRLRLPYDEADHELAERVRGVPAYYPRECELRLLDEHLPEIAREVGAGVRVLAPGQQLEVRRLVRALDRPAGTGEARLGDELDGGPGTLVYLPGTPADELEPHDAVQRLARLARPGAQLLLASDGTRDRSALVAAYDDDEGLTAELERCALAHLACTRGLELESARFERRVIWNELRARVEVVLVARGAQAIGTAAGSVELAAGEPIVVRQVYKHSLHAMRGLLVAAGWHVTVVYAARAREVRLWLCTRPA